MKSILPLIGFFSLASANPGMAANLHDSYLNPLPVHHVYQYSPRLGRDGSMYCGPAAVVESIAFLKWFRQPGFSLLKWSPDAPRIPSGNDDGYLYSQTLEFVKILKTDPNVFPSLDRFVTDPANIVRGLRQYFQDSGYDKPWVYARGLRAFDAPEGRSVEDMRQPVTLAEVREFTRLGFGVILLIGYYDLNGYFSDYIRGRPRLAQRYGGHYLAVFGFNHDSSLGDDQTEFIVTNSLGRPSYQPQNIRFSGLEKNPRVIYPDHIKYKVDGHSSHFLDTAIFFIPSLNR